MCAYAGQRFLKNLKSKVAIPRQPAPVAARLAFFLKMTDHVQQPNARHLPSRRTHQPG